MRPGFDRALERQRVVQHATVLLAVLQPGVVIEGDPIGVQLGVGVPRIFVATAQVERQDVGEHVPVAQLVVDRGAEVVAGEGVLSQHVLLGSGQKDVQRIEPQPVVDPVDVALPEIEPVGGERGPGAALVPEIARHVVAVRRRCAEREPAAGAEIGVLLEHDVDDPGHALRVVARRRSRHDLDPVDDVRRQLLEVGAQLVAADGSGPPVDLDGDVLVAPQADLALGIDVHRRDRDQDLARRRCGRSHVLRAVAVAVGLDGDGRPLDRHVDPFDGDGRRHHPDRSRVRAGSAGADREVGRAQSIVSDRGDLQVIRAGRKALDLERTVATGDVSRDQRRVGLVVDRDRGPVDRAAVRIEHAAVDLAAGPRTGGRALPRGHLGVDGGNREQEQAECDERYALHG